MDRLSAPMITVVPLFAMHPTMVVPVFVNLSWFIDWIGSVDVGKNKSIVLVLDTDISSS